MTQLQKNSSTYPLLSIARHRMGTDGTGITTLVAGAGCPLHCADADSGQQTRDLPGRYTQRCCRKISAYVTVCEQEIIERKYE